jgi:hypothetical protein
MFDYMRKKNGNIIAVVDKKKRVYRAVLKTIPKGSVRRFQENGSLSAERIKEICW